MTSAAAQSRIRVAFFDVDGVLTNCTKLYHEDGSVSKLFHDHDSYGLKLLTEAGVDVIIVSADDRVNRSWAERQGLPFLLSSDKAGSVAEVLAEKRCDAGAAAYVGDDLRDLEAMKLVAFSMAPRNAAPSVYHAAKYRLRRRGGMGAAREAAELILRINNGGES